MSQAAVSSAVILPSRTRGAIGASSEPFGDLSASASLDSALRLFASKWDCLGRGVGEGIRSCVSQMSRPPRLTADPATIHSKTKA